MYPSIDPRFMTAAEQHRVELVRPEQQCEPRESRRPYPVDHRTADAVVVGPQPHGTTRIANDVCRLVRTVLLTLAMHETTAPATWPRRFPTGHRCPMWSAGIALPPAPSERQPKTATPLQPSHITAPPAHLHTQRSTT